MKGIILAGGTGSRLWPTTKGVSKQLLPIYDKPLIYYPLSVLMLAGISDILIITTPEDEKSFRNLLGDGAAFGVRLEFINQTAPRGIAEAFILGARFVGADSVTLILGDNVFWGQGLSDQLTKATSLGSGATIFGYRVKDPKRFGVVNYRADGTVESIEEKPLEPKSDIAVTGLYIFDNDVVRFAKEVKPSARGELEITSILNAYLAESRLNLEMFGRGFAWLDTGTSEALLEASSFIETIERQQGLKVACLEEIALNSGWLTHNELRSNLDPQDKSVYGTYVKSLVGEIN